MAEEQEQEQGHGQGEQAAWQSEAMFRVVVEAAPDGLVMVDEDGHILMVNRALEELFGWPREALLGQAIELLLPTEARAEHVARRQAYWSQAASPLPVQRRALSGLRRDGSTFAVEVSLNPVQTGTRRHVLATVVDLTRRHADHAALTQALAEKTALLQEVHHRVKNNLQVISSLLSLQLRATGAGAREALIVSQQRVKAMALIHQLLYEQGDVSQVPLAAYLGKLVALLQAGMGSDRVKLVLDFSPAAEGVVLGLKRAVPCGLLVNEMVTNALKHAYPSPQSGTVLVSLREGEGGRAVITVADQGVGLPPTESLVGENGSVGFQLIPVLARQMGAHLHVDQAGGTAFALTFEPEDQEASAKGR